MTKKQPKDQGGHDTTYTDKMADKILSRLADGDSLRTVCRAEDMPARSTVFKWLREIDGFSDQYTRAKEESADAIAEELFDICDDGSNDWMEKLNRDGGPAGVQLNSEHIQRSKLRVDTRKWYLSKIKPKKYGEKQQVDLNATLGLSDLTGDELDRKLRALEAAVEQSAED